MSKHEPVLLKESIDLLNLRAGSYVIDCTLGLGGHSLEILKRIGPSGKLMAFDQDERNLKVARENLKKFEKQITYVHSNFENLEEEVKKHNFAPDAILFDLGLSSPHVDDPKRGFSFRLEGPLDMRYDQRSKLTADIVVNQYKENDLADVIFQYGEETRSRPIARAIVQARPIKTTIELADVVANTFKHKTGVHPATKTFQGLRIYINQELDVLESALDQAIQLLKVGGRIAVISYHSLEDRIVKTIFKHYTRDCICPKELPLCQCDFRKKLYLLTKKPIIPPGIEVQANPRARSAKMRAAERI